MTLLKILYIFFCLFLLTGCNIEIENYEYVGKSDNWEAIFTYRVEYFNNGDNSSRDEVKINYIGDKKLQKGTVIEYTYKLGAKSGSNTYELEEMEESGEIEGAGSGGINLSTLQGDETGIVTISWMENMKKLKLRGQKNKKSCLIKI